MLKMVRVHMTAGELPISEAQQEKRRREKRAAEKAASLELKSKEKAAKDAARLESKVQKSNKPNSDKPVVKAAGKIDSQNDFTQDTMPKPVMKPVIKIDSRNDFAPDTIPDLQDPAGALAKEPYNLQKAKSKQKAAHRESRSANSNISGLDGTATMAATDKSVMKEQSKDRRAVRGAVGMRGGNLSSVDSDEGPSEPSDDDEEDEERPLKSRSKTKASKKSTKNSKPQASAKESTKPQSEAGNSQKVHDPNASLNDECEPCDSLQRTNQQTMLDGAIAKSVTFRDAPKNGTPKYGSITLDLDCRMQFSGFPDALASQIGNEIAKYGGCGVKRERQWGLGYEFILRGDPWGDFKGRVLGVLAGDNLGRVIGDGGATREERFFRHLFQVMHGKNYSLYLAQQGMKGGVGTYFFKKSSVPFKEDREYITISFHMPNRLRLTCAPEDFAEAVKSLLEKNPRFKGERDKTQRQRERTEKQKEKGAKKQREKEVKKQKARGHKNSNEEPPAVEYKIPGIAWSNWHHVFRWAPEKRMKVTAARKFRLDLLNLLEDQGWKEIHVADRDMRRGTEYEDHVPNAWYFYREITGDKQQKALAALPSDAPRVDQGRAKTV